MSENIIHLIGVGMTGFDAVSRRGHNLIASSEVLVGHRRHLDMFPDYCGEKMELGDLSELLAFLQRENRKIVVMASGDPAFFGISRFILRNLPKERIEILPNVTSMQYAFSRIKEPWDDAIFVSVHGRGMEAAIDKIISAEKSCILTDSVNSPAAISRELVARGAEGYEAWLCEDLGLESEKFTRSDLKGLQELQHSPLNLLILIKMYEPNILRYPLIGIEDDHFQTSKKLITKQEIRAVTLAKLQLQDDLVMWDIGAGSCSVSIEASNLMPHGRIFAIERNPQCISFIQENLKKFSPRNIKLVQGEAPEAFETLPDPDRVFIGGTGGHLDEIVDAVSKRLKPDGIIVLNAVTLETLAMAIESLEDNGYSVEASCINVARTRKLAEHKIMEALNPVYVISAVKEGL